MQSKTRRLTESAMLLSVAIVLELVSKMFIPEQPFGGQITFAAMLPVILISYRHGMKWGFLASFTYALIEMVIGGKTYRGTELRQKLGLRSTAFSVSVGEYITITTRGYGHRVGMSQYGADAMALEGKDYTQILAHYYQGTVLTSLDAVVN